MVSNATLNSEIICDLSGQPLERTASALLKALDQLLTVGAYYSPEHGQYHVVSEKSCEQIVQAILPNMAMEIEITAAGMMIRSQVLDPNHRNVRLLYDLLVPLNIARMEISVDLTPEDLRLAISVLQEHKQNLGHTTGFQEIKIENLPPTVSTASRDVVDGGDGWMDLDDMSGDDSTAKDAKDKRLNSERMSHTERLARKFMEIVGRALDNLEQDQTETGEDKSTANPESTPENIKALRTALRRLVEVNPDPDDLARLIEHAKRALELSQDPDSVDLVFSLLKQEAKKGGDWKNKAREKGKNKPKKEYRLSLEELRQEVASLETQGDSPAEPGPSSLTNYLGICFHLLAVEPSEALEISLVTNLEWTIINSEMTQQDLSLCSSAVATAVLKNKLVVIDSVLPAFCNPLRASRSYYLLEFWTNLWKSLDDEHRALVWPHLVSDLLLGMGDANPQLMKEAWLSAGKIDYRAALKQVSRLERTPALRDKVPGLSLMSLPLVVMYPVHLALMKSSRGPVHGPLLHEHLLRQPPNDFIKIMMTVLGEYDRTKDKLYLSLINQSAGDSISPELSKVSARLLSKALTDLPAKNRNKNWVPQAINWIGKLDHDSCLPLMTRIRNQKKFFFFKAWPPECRELAEQIVSDAASSTEETSPADAKERR